MQWGTRVFRKYSTSCRHETSGKPVFIIIRNKVMRKLQFLRRIWYALKHRSRNLSNKNPRILAIFARNTVTCYWQCVTATVTARSMFCFPLISTWLGQMHMKSLNRAFAAAGECCSMDLTFLSVTQLKTGKETSLLKLLTTLQILYSSQKHWCKLSK